MGGLREVSSDCDWLWRERKGEIAVEDSLGRLIGTGSGLDGRFRLRYELLFSDCRAACSLARSAGDNCDNVCNAAIARSDWFFSILKTIPVNIFQLNADAKVRNP